MEERRRLKMVCKRRKLANAILCVATLVLLTSPASARIDVFTAHAISDAENFKVENFFLKINLRQGEFAEREIAIKSDKQTSLSLSVDGLKGVSLNTNHMELAPGEKKLLKVKFNATELAPSVYNGLIKIKEGTRIKSVPVVFEVESKDLFFDVTLEIPPDYAVVKPGGKLVANAKIFDLTGFKGPGALGASSVRVEYALHSSGGQLIASEEESMVINKQTQLSKTFVLPNSTAEGDYVLSAVVRYRSSVGVASRVFSVRVPFSEGNARAEEETNKILLYATLFAFAFLALSLAAFYSFILHERRKLISEIQRHNELEMKRQRELLLAQRKLAVKKGLSSRKVDREIEKKLSKVREIHKRRLEEARKARARGEIKEMKKKIEEWKKKGYNTLALELKLKELSEGEMKRLLRKWKEKI